MLPTLPLATLPLLLLLPLTLSLLPPLPNPAFPLPYNTTTLTSPPPPGQNNGNCVPHLSDWTIAGWIWEDCYAAVQQLYISDVMAKSATEYEFLDRGSVPSQVELPRVVVPRRWIEGTCTVTVMTMKTMYLRFGTSELPGMKRRQFPASDFAAFRTVYAGAKMVEYTCDGRKVPGWVQVGDKDALGVFIWGTGSYMDRAVGQSGTLPAAMTLSPATIGAGGGGADVSSS